MANAYEAGQRKAIPAVLIYPECGGEVLMLHRNTRPGDFHAGKWNGLGGKCEPDESPLETARRELREESGLDLPPEAFRPLGFLQFPNFKPKKAEDWLVYVFAARVPPGRRGGPDPGRGGPDPGRGDKLPCPEGTLEWIERGKVLELNLWDGDRRFLPLVLEGRPFIGTLWYRDGGCVRHWVRPL